MGPDRQVTPLGYSGPVSSAMLDGSTPPGLGKHSCTFLCLFFMLAGDARDVVRCKLQFSGQEGLVAPGLFEKLPPSL